MILVRLIDPPSKKQQQQQQQQQSLDEHQQQYLQQQLDEAGEQQQQGVLGEPLGRARPGEDDSLVMDVEGGLLRSTSCFPYFMLVALEAGSPLRALILLLLGYPVAVFLRYVVSTAAEIAVMTFVAVAGLKASTVESVSLAVLAKFFLDDLNPEAWRVYKACGRRDLVTSMPTIMVRAFARHYLKADEVMGSEVEITTAGICTGRLKLTMEGDQRWAAVRRRVRDEERVPTIGVCSSANDSGFLRLCKSAYIAGPAKDQKVPRKDYIKPLVFHDGRLVHRPTPLHSLVVLLWLPIGFLLAVVRVAVGLSLPKRAAVVVEAFLGVSLRVRGKPPPAASGVLFVCTHRSLLDPVFISYACLRNVRTVTYSVSRLSEVLSPIRTARLARSRSRDAATMAALLREGDLAVCPEGTTCREPYLLRFSPLFAELTDHIVPVAVSIRLSMFHATTARGWKGLDPLFYFMNPSPSYEVTFLDQIQPEQTCSAGGRPSHEVANHVQKLLADSLGYECTNLTRRDKYQMLAGNDGIVKGSDKGIWSWILKAFY